MKLNKKNTILIGFAFLSITAFWQMYDNMVPLILTNTFNMNKTISGLIMAADNILALFLLPLFGTLSDKSNFRMGKRKPFILFGTIAAVVFMTGLPLLDNSYYASPSPLKTAGFIIILGLLLIAMGTYRSPAVALMPDVTPRPLRSKGNAIINLMGAIGGIVYLLASSVLFSEKKTAGLDHVNYMPIFIVVAIIMLASLAILLFFVNEPKLRAKQAEYEKAHPEEELAVEETTTQKKVMPKSVKLSLLFLLLSVALWYIGYNAVNTWFTTYATNVWNMALGDASMCLTIAMAGAIISYIPVGVLAGKIGRKISILIGAGLLAVCFFAAYIYTVFSDSFHPILYVLFVLIGIAWATINVNSFPMVVEMCAGADVGKFTGYYYTFSMAAQTITPVLAGTLLSKVGYNSLFPYAAIFVAASFLTMCFVKHGDSEK